jgi:hypothetical protein
MPVRMTMMVVATINSTKVKPRSLLQAEGTLPCFRAPKIIVNTSESALERDCAKGAVVAGRSFGGYESVP